MSRSDAAEQAIIAALLVDTSQIPVVESRLTGSDFGKPYGAIFDRMVQMSHEGKRIDVVTLKSDGYDIPLDVLSILSHARTDDLGPYIEAVLEHSFRRRVADFGARIQQASQSAADPSEILGELQAFNSALAQEARDHRLVDGGRAATMYLEELQHRRTSGSGIPYGISPMDALIQPAVGGDMIVVAGRPSMGKTALAEVIADNWAFESPRPVLFVSIEMRLSALIDRAVSRWSEIPAQDLIRGRISADQEILARETLDRRRSVNIWYADDPMATTSSIRAHAARAALQNDGLAGIVVDYLQIVKDAGDQEVQRVTKISRNLKAIAREFDVPLIALSQLSRASENRENKRPRLSDLRESGAIEQDADLVLGLYRQGHDMEILILKNRQGPAGISLNLRFDNDTMNFYEGYDHGR